METTAIGYVYMWTNNINDKKYIGLHFGSEEDGYIGSGTAFTKAIVKYGIENFTRAILYREYKDRHSLYLKEYEIITELNAVKSREFYNLTNFDPKYPVGEFKTRTLTDETKAKLRAKAIGRKASDATKLKMSLKRKGVKVSAETSKKLSLRQMGSDNHTYGKKYYTDGINNKLYIPGEQSTHWKLGRVNVGLVGDKNPFYGRTHTEETKEKLRKQKLGQAAPNCRSVICDGIRYPSLKLAAMALKLPYSSTVVHRINSSKYNYHYENQAGDVK